MTNSEIKKCEHSPLSTVSSGVMTWCGLCGAMRLIGGDWEFPTRTPVAEGKIYVDWSCPHCGYIGGFIKDADKPLTCSKCNRIITSSPRTPGPTKLSDYACSSCGVLAGHAFNCKPEPTNIHKLDFEITKIFEELRVMHDVPKSVLESLEGLIRKRNPEPTKAENGLDINNLKNLDLFKLSEEELDDLLFVLKKTIAVINIKESPSITKEQLLAILPENLTHELERIDDRQVSEEVWRVIETINKMKQRIEELGK